MQSRGFLELGPSELAALCRAFDDAWEVVKPRCSMELSEIARLCLAEDVLDAYRNGLLDADLIAAHALENWNKTRLLRSTPGAQSAIRLPRPATSMGSSQMRSIVRGRLRTP